MESCHHPGPFTASNHCGDCTLSRRQRFQTDHHLMAHNTLSRARATMVSHQMALLMLLLWCLFGSLFATRSYAHNVKQDEAIARGTYPRGTTYNGTLLVCVGMSVYARSSTTTSDGTWTKLGTVASDPRPGVDLANCNLAVHPGPNPVIVASFRHHTGCQTDNARRGSKPQRRAGHRFDTSQLLCRNYSIQVATSHDGGVSWQWAGTVSSGPIGMWEPFLFFNADSTANPGPTTSSVTHGLTTSGDPRHPHATGVVLHVAYSQEITNGGLQSIVWCATRDNGTSWSAPTVLSDGRDHQSRDGMPGIARLRDGSLFLVFEGFWAHGRGHFSVQGRRSYDGGATWDAGRVIYNTSSARTNAGAPQVAVFIDGRVAVSFMTDEDTASRSWPTDAWAKVMISNNTGIDGEQLWFPETSKQLVCTGPHCMWPGLFGQDPVYVTYEHNGVSYLQPVVGAANGSNAKGVTSSVQQRR